MTHQAPPSARFAGPDPGRQVAQLREALRLVERIAGRRRAPRRRRRSTKRRGSAPPMTPRCRSPSAASRRSPPRPRSGPPPGSRRCSPPARPRRRAPPPPASPTSSTRALSELAASAAARRPLLDPDVALRAGDGDPVLAEQLQHPVQDLRADAAEPGLGIADPDPDLVLDRIFAELGHPDRRLRRCRARAGEALAASTISLCASLTSQS